MGLEEESLRFHKEHKGKLDVDTVKPISGYEDLSILYSPGVAWPCRKIKEDNDKLYEYTIKGRTVGVVTDGSAVLGLGDIGEDASLPVMEGKAALIREFTGLNSFPIPIDADSVDEFVHVVERIETSFGAINIEDVKAPECFEIEQRLKEMLDIPVFHDDQHGTAIVVQAGLYNALKIVNKDVEEADVVVIGAGAAGMAITKLLDAVGVKDISVYDSTGLIRKGRGDMNDAKEDVATITKDGNDMPLTERVNGSDVCIGVSVPGMITSSMVESMSNPIIFALANPDPEILPEDAYEAGAEVVATGRSDYPNQVNNVLAFPGVFKGLLSGEADEVTNEMKIKAAKAIAQEVSDLGKESILPDPFDRDVVDAVADAIRHA